MKNKLNVNDYYNIDDIFVVMQLQYSNNNSIKMIINNNYYYNSK